MCTPYLDPDSNKLTKKKEKKPFEINKETWIWTGDYEIR